MIRQTCAILVLLLLSATASAQSTDRQRVQISSPLCTRTNALDTIQQQIASTKSFNNTIQRIDVLLRSADLLWPYEREKSLAAFLEAFDLAKQNYKETVDGSNGDSKFLVSNVPDQRFKVITAFAKRAPAEARKLSEQALNDDKRDLENDSTAQQKSRKSPGEKLLEVAHSLVETDAALSATFARASLRYPASLYLPLYFYALTKTNKPAADLLYEEAITAYGGAPMDQFLYLSSYPFGNTREAGEMPGWTIYRLPDGFVPSTRLQRMFVQQLLARVQLALETPVEGTTTSRYSDSAQMWLALSRLDQQIQQALPDLAPAVTQSKDKLFALITPENQKRVEGTIASDNPPKLGFEEKVEAAEKLSDVNARDQQLTFAVTNVTKDTSTERVVAVIDKISDDGIRRPLLNRFYFFRTQALITDKRYDEAHSLAAKNTELDQRAYLFAKLAEELLKASSDQTQAREMLNELADATSKAPKTIVTARAALALANLYSRIDANRGIEELAHAVKAINELESPDFSVQYVMMKIEGKTFGTYAGFQTPGFVPETAFREIARIDFDGALIQAATLRDKTIRSFTTLAIIEPCLEITQTKSQRKKP
jgi:hypothetical protein